MSFNSSKNSGLKLFATQSPNSNHHLILYNKFIWNSLKFKKEYTIQKNYIITILDLGRGKNLVI